MNLLSRSSLHCVKYTLLNELWTRGFIMRLTFKEVKDEISKIVPKSIEYSVELEAGNIAIVTTEPQKLSLIHI